MTTALKREWEDNNDVNDDDDNGGLNNNNGMSEYELMRMGNIARNNVIAQTNPLPSPEQTPCSNRCHVERRSVQHPQSTAPIIESTKDKATIKMVDDCIDSDGVVS
jgi:hypothetical protein